LKDPDLKGETTDVHWEWRLNCCKCCQITVEMKTSPCYCDIIIPTDTKVH